MLRIDCDCGEALLVAPEAMGGTIVCWKCGSAHATPEELPAARQGPAGETAEERERHKARWFLPIVGSFIAIVLIAAALVWALSASGGEGGIGDDGLGTGPLAEGDGSGAGLLGEGSGEGTTGAGTTGDPTDAAVSVADSDNDGPPDPVPPRPRAPVRKIETDLSELDEQVPPVPPPPAPPARPTAEAGDPGREGAGGGGGGGTGGGGELGARGDVSFTLTWQYDLDRQGEDGSGGPDIDIWVLDPLGQRINTSTEPPISVGPTPQGGRADRDDRGGYGTGNGGGPERIFWPEGRSPGGVYRYGVRWFRGKGSARYVMKVYLGEELVDTKTGLLASSDAGKNIELGSVTQDD